MNSDLQDNSFNNYPHNEILSYKWTNCLFTEAINQNKEVNLVSYFSLSLPCWFAQLVYKLISKYVLLVGIDDLSRCKVIAIFGLQRWGFEFETTLKAFKALEHDLNTGEVHLKCSKEFNGSQEVFWLF